MNNMRLSRLKNGTGWTTHSANQKLEGKEGPKKWRRNEQK